MKTLLVSNISIQMYMEIITFTAEKYFSATSAQTISI